VRILFASILLVGCTPAEPTSTTSQPLVCATDASGIDARELVQARAGAVMSRTSWTEQGNHHPTARFVLRRGTQSFDLGDALAAVLVDESAAVVRIDGTLERFDRRGCAQVIAHDVLPDLAVSPDARTLAFVQRIGDGTGLWLSASGGLRRVASAFVDADRPLFVDARSLVFVGAARPGRSTFHRVSLDDGVPKPLPIDGIPASRAGYEHDNGIVRFHDGERLRTLNVGAAQ
jgi:hypothetical protein